MVVSILIFLVMFSLIVVSHEFGHYIVGKKNGIHSVEFMIGVGPKLFKWTKDDTEFSVRLLPFGGACIFEGIDELEEENAVESEHSFYKASVWSRIATTLAGPVFNIVLAYLCGIVLSYSTGEVIPVIQTVIEDSGAQEAGLREGDLITKINGHHVHLSSEVSFDSFYSAGKPMNITVKRDGQKMNFLVVPKYSEEDRRYYIGITNGQYVECKDISCLKYGFYNVEYILRATLESVRMIFTGQVKKDDFSGPVGIVKIVDDTYDEAKEYGALEVVLSMVNITMLLAANLAVMNLLPIPGLDGGRLLFLLIEVVRRKPVPREKEGYVTLAGMALILVFVVFVLFNDISKFFH